MAQARGWFFSISVFHFFLSVCFEISINRLLLWHHVWLLILTSLQLEHTQDTQKVMCFVVASQTGLIFSAILFFYAWPTMFRWWLCGNSTDGCGVPPPSRTEHVHFNFAGVWHQIPQRTCSSGVASAWATLSSVLLQLALRQFPLIWKLMTSCAGIRTLLRLTSLLKYRKIWMKPRYQSTQFWCIACQSLSSDHSMLLLLPV